MGAAVAVPEPYTPISCVDHERLEFAALTRQWVEVEYGGERLRLRPLDLRTEAGAEWLDAEDPGGVRRVLRLDTFRLIAG